MLAKGNQFGIAASSLLIRPPLSPAAHLLILVPRQGLRRQHEPVLLGAALHQADVVDGQPAPADHLVGRTHLSREDNPATPPTPSLPSKDGSPVLRQGYFQPQARILAPYQPKQSQLGIRRGAGTGVGMDGDTDRQEANH